jgi:hypothetical protein
MTQYKKYNLYVWLWVVLCPILLKIISIFIPNSTNGIVNSWLFLFPIIVLAYLGTGWVGSELKIVPIKADVSLFDNIKNVYFKMFFRIIITAVYFYLLFQILLFIMHADCIRRYGIGLCVPR